MAVMDLREDTLVSVEMLVSSSGRATSHCKEQFQ